ncbi:MAG TPA: hypothetical protein VFO76_11375, partial [Candidatus Kapabacteria bacterium]|nr:hypothetical protein [Candidatus Kapabacteria bacterium]
MLRSLVLSAALYILCCATAFAQIPRQISYQGLILTQNNKPIADGTHSMTFIIKDGSGAVQYTGTQTVTTKGGIFSANIGPIPNGVDFGQQYFLSVQIEGTDIIPATAFTTAPYAFHAEIANGLTPNATGVVTSVNETSGGIRIVGDSTVGITQSGQTITLHSFAVGPGGSGGVQSVQSPEKTI